MTKKELAERVIEAARLVIDGERVPELFADDMQVLSVALAAYDAAPDDDGPQALDELAAETERLGLYPWQADAAAERAAIVAWLRGLAGNRSNDLEALIGALAFEIDRGDHAKERRGECEYDPDHLYHECQDNRK